VAVTKTSYNRLDDPDDLRAAQAQYYGLNIPLTVVYFTGGGWAEGVTLPDFKAQVARGCELLDLIEPGWEKRVDPSILDLDDRTSCVLGQVYADKSELTGYDYKVKTHMTEHGLSPSEHGFDLTSEQRAWLSGSVNYIELALLPLVSRAWEHLSATWADEIRERQMARSLDESNVPG
jgi:hypothetical protein